MWLLTTDLAAPDKVLGKSLLYQDSAFAELPLPHDKIHQFLEGFI